MAASVGTTAASGGSPETHAATRPVVMQQVTWEIDGLLDDRPCTYTFDPGAVFTISQRGLLPAPTNPSPNVRMRQAEKGTALTPLYGPRAVNITVGGCRVPTLLFEGDIHEQCLLGADFVASQVKTLDVDNDLLILKGENAGQPVKMRRVVKQVEALSSTLRVECSQLTVVPPHTEMVVPIVISGCDIWDGGIGDSGAGGATGWSSAPAGDGPPGHPSPGLSSAPDGDGLPCHSSRGSSSVPDEDGLPSRRATATAASRDIISVRRTACIALPVSLPPGIQIASPVLAGDNRSMVVRVRNVTAHPKTLKRKMCLTRLKVTPLAATNLAAGESADPAGPLEELIKRSNEGLTEAQAKQTKALITEFQDIISCGNEIGHCTLTEHDIDTGDAAPIKQQARRLGMFKQQIADKCIDEMLAQDVIGPSDSPWAFPVVLLTKKDGKPRFAVDYQKLNSVTKKDAYPLPRIDDTLESLKGASWFSSLDIKWGYWNIPLTARARPKTAFAVPGHGLYEFKRMPFGLCNAGATFQRVMDKIVPRRLARVYLDDIIVPGKTFEEALASLREVFQAIREAKFLLHPRKIHLFRRKLPYLGRVVDKDGIHPDPGRVQKVAEWPVPTKKEELKSFLHFGQYYARFIPAFSKLAAPLHQLTGKAARFEWTPEVAASFNNLREALVSPAVLAYPDPQGGSFILDCDASGFALGMVLSQEQNGEERPIEFHGRVLSRPERNYCVTRRELLAIVDGVKHFHHYLTGRSFVVRTDHIALKWLFSLKDTDGQLARWLERLSAYDFTVVHRPGRLHANADALSRRPCDPGCRHCSHHEQPTVPVQRVRLRDGDGPIDFGAAQSTDLDIAPLLQGIRNGARPSSAEISDRSDVTKTHWLQWKSLEVTGGVLHRRVDDPDQGAYRQLVVPKLLVPSVLRQFHDAVGSGGHLGGYKTLAKIRRRYYWPGMRQDVKLWCLSCETCFRRKGPHLRTRAPLRTYNVGSPWERVAIDLAGEYPKTSRGNRYLLVLIDYFTRWPEAIPIPSKHADVVARALVDNVFTRFGAPCELHSDQGRSFECAVFKKVLELMGTGKTRTTPLRPQSDGAVERMIRTLVVQLSLTLDASQADWDLQVPLTLMTLRNAPHSTTGVSPAMMLLGRDLDLPPTLIRDSPPHAPALSSRMKYPVWLRDHLRRLHHQVRDRVREVMLHQKQRYDRRVHNPEFKAGDLVWLFDPRRDRGRNPKLQGHWKGPYVIVSLVNDVVAKVELKGDPRAKHRTVHVDRLARFVSRRIH